MEILGIGPLELILILIIALIVLGPNDMVKAGRTLGRLMRSIVTSPTWQMIQQTSREFRYLPNRLMREAGMEELKESLPKSKELSKQMGLDDLNKDMKTREKDLSDWTTTPSPTIGTPSEPLESPEQDSAAEISAGLDSNNAAQETQRETSTETE
jgi:sec-independent protein translocase protein TatB